MLGASLSRTACCHPRRKAEVLVARGSLLCLCLQAVDGRGISTSATSIHSDECILIMMMRRGSDDRSMAATAFS